MFIATSLLISIAVFGLLGVFIYNRLNRLRERVRSAFSQIDVQLERRYDLIPNLVTVAQRYLTHEQETLTAVISARASATQARIDVNGDPGNTAALERLGQADGSLGNALGRLLMVTEQYPELQGDATMATLTEEIRSTENRVGFARQAYNDATRRYETTRQSFPSVVAAPVLGFEPFAYFEASSEESKRPVTVEFAS